MGWVFAIVLAVAALAVMIAVLKVPRRTWEAIAATLLFGLVGFALQAKPGLPSAPKATPQSTARGGEALVKARLDISSSGPLAGSKFLIIADGFARRGEFRDAAEISLAAAESAPNDANAWLSLANNLVAHADGNLTPAAQHAYDRAMAADPTHPGPKFFLGLALAQNGQLAQGRAMWADLLAHSPQGAPWRKDLEARLADLDAFIARQNDAGQRQ